MRTCCCFPLCQERLWTLSAARAHQLPQVWILLVQDLCSSHGKELVPIPPTSPNGTQKGKERKRRREGEKGWAKCLLAHTFKAKLCCIMENWLRSPATRVMFNTHKNHYTNSPLCTFCFSYCAWRNYDSSSWLPIKVASYSFVPVYILQKSDALQV